MSLSITPTLIRKHHPIFWTATVIGAPFPPQGIALAVQVKEGQRWQTSPYILLSRSGGAVGSSRKIEYELECFLKGALLIEGQMADSSTESTGVNGGDHLAEDLRCVAVQRDLRVEAGRKR
jgi:hypothetical protein